MDKPRVFISYSHADGSKKFVRRLASNLDLHANVFWDQRIDPGPFDEVLEREIETRKYFTQVMTPFSAREGSGCREELRCAQYRARTIIPIQISQDFFDDELKKFTPARFFGSFDKGFRDLTRFLGIRPVLPWEHFKEADEEETVLNALYAGLLPVPLMKEFGEWVIIDHLWSFIEAEVKGSAISPIRLGSPRTVDGVVKRLKKIPRQLHMNQDPNGILNNHAQKALSIVQDYSTAMQTVTESDNIHAGETTRSLIDATQTFYVLASLAFLDAWEIDRLQEEFIPNMVEKIKELITDYSRRLSM